MSLLRRLQGLASMKAFPRTHWERQHAARKDDDAGQAA